MSRNNSFTTENSLDFSYHQNYYKLISIDLSRKTNTSIPQQINFIGKLKEDDDAIMFIPEKQQKAVLNFSLDPLIVRTSNILNLLNESSDSKFVTRKWNIVNDQPNANYDVRNESINTEVSKSNRCDYNDGYISVRGDITIIGHNLTQVAFKNCTTFTKCITKTDRRTVDDAEDLDLIMSIYNLLEYNSNYSERYRVYGFVLKLKQLILMLILLMVIILNLSALRVN